MYSTKLELHKTCDLCGKEFVTNKASKHICNEDHFNVCVVCGKQFLIDWGSRNKLTCSKECMKIQMSRKLSSKEVREKTEVTNLERYGTRAPAQSKKIKEDVKRRNLEKYGVDHPSKLEKTQEKRRKTNLERYGVTDVTKSAMIRDKIKKANLERYGVENPSSAPEIREKIKATTQERYGVDNVMQVPEFVNKAKETCIERYGTKYPSQTDEIKEKTKATNRERFGVDWAFQSEEVQEKICETNLERYGTIYPAQDPSVKEKQKESLQERYGGYTFQSKELREKVRNTMIEKYGVPYPLQSEEIRSRVISTNQERYGVDWSVLKNDTSNYQIRSKLNLKFEEYLNKNGVRCVAEFPLGNRCYDFRIEDTNILVELDPTITHNTYYNIFDSEATGIPVTYHLDKSKLASNHGYRCIHIFDWDNWEIVLAILEQDKFPLPIRSTYILNMAKEDLTRYLKSNYELVSMIDPQLHWSKNSENITGKGILRKESDYLEDGYFPVYDCGKAMLKYVGK